MRELDLEQKIACVEPREVDYYTQPVLDTNIRVREELQRRDWRGESVRLGEVTYSWQTIAMKKVRFHSLDSIGYHPLELPRLTLDTTGFWFAPGEEAWKAVARAGLNPMEGLSGVRNLFVTLLSMLSMCDPSDLGGMIDSSNLGRPGLFLFDRYPGGLGFSEQGYARLRRAGAALARAPRGVRVRFGLPLVRRAPHTAAGAAAGSRSRPRPRGARQGGGARPPPPLVRPNMTETVTTPSDWPIAFFDDDYLKLYAPRLTPERTRAEADFIARELGLAPGERVLDLACGVGRHAVAMAARGHRVTGFDFNAHYLELGSRAASAAGVAVTWTQGDMRAFAFDPPFDAAYSYFTSFGYYSDEENERVLANVAGTLRPGGRFLIEVADRDYMLTHPLTRGWTQRDDGALIMEENTLDLVTSRVTSRQILIEPGAGSRVTKQYDLRVYTCAELSALMRRNGLHPLRAFGGSDGAAYSRRQPAADPGRRAARGLMHRPAAPRPCAP